MEANLKERMVSFSLVRAYLLVRYRSRCRIHIAPNPCVAARAMFVDTKDVQTVKGFRPAYPDLIAITPKPLVVYQEFVFSFCPDQEKLSVKVIPTFCLSVFFVGDFFETASESF